MLIHDTAIAAARTRTPEGFLQVRARIARTGIHLYQAAELGAPDGWVRDGSVRVYRPPEAVFDSAAMASFALRPVTDEHPPAMVDATNWKRYAVGQSGAAVERDGDLRAGACQITPKVEARTKTVTPSTAEWSVAGLDRATAPLVSQIDPSTLDPTGLAGAAPPTGLVPAFGGTPSDASVREAIANLKSRGLRIMFYPFIMMDVPPGNGLPDPYGGAEQAPYPWRGRVTCHPAPGQPDTVDKTADAASQVDAFLAQYGAMATHYAQLCVDAGGVDSFVIGSELVGLTQVRSGAGDAAYPAVQGVKGLAAAVKAIVGPGCKVGYAADWTEYHSHRPADGTHDVIFNMDPLWSDPNIDFIGLDNYLPMSDWRDGAPNVDADPVAGPFTIYDKDYLAGNIEGGEDYDWYYAMAADRVAQVRTPIVDTAYAEHWVFRQKDIRAWWANSHHSRPGGVRDSAATSFVPQGKPIWFTEFGCPAVDKGPNQPNVFYDPKSSESALPYFSLDSKDDPVQRAYLETMLSYWRDHAPTSAVYGGPMLTTDNMFAWAWDARPFPDFPVARPSGTTRPITSSVTG